MFAEHCQEKAEQVRQLYPSGYRKENQCKRCQMNSIDSYTFLFPSYLKQMTNTPKKKSDLAINIIIPNLGLPISNFPENIRSQTCNFRLEL